MTDKFEKTLPSLENPTTNLDLAHANQTRDEVRSATKERETPENNASGSFQIIRSSEFVRLPLEYKKKAVQLVSEAVVHHPTLEPDFMRCADVFLSDPDLAMASANSFAKSAPAHLFKTLAVHHQFGILARTNAPFHKLVQETAFQLAGSEYSPHAAHYPFLFVLRNRDLQWSNSFLMWVALKAPHFMLMNANHKEWPNDGFKMDCLATAAKNLKKVTSEILILACPTFNEPWAEKMCQIAAQSNQACTTILGFSSRIKAKPWGNLVLKTAAQTLLEESPPLLAHQLSSNPDLAELGWVPEMTRETQSRIEKSTPQDQKKWGIH